MKFVISILILLTFRATSYALDVDSLFKSSDFLPVVQLHKSGQTVKAIKMLEGIPLVASKEGLRLFLLSKYNYELSFYDEALKAINEAIKKKVPHLDYAYYLKGLIESEANKNLSSAQKSIETVLKHNPILALQKEAEYLLGKIYFDQRKNDLAEKFLTKSLKGFSRDSRKPEILWYLTKIHFSKGKSWKACKYARDIYRNFPYSRFISDWNINLSNNKVGSRNTGCSSNYGDKKRRLKKLLWAGKKEKAAMDVDYLKTKAGFVSDLDKRRLLAEYYIHIGDVKLALSTLLAKYKTYKNKVNYLTLLGFAAFKAGEFQVSIGSYYRAYKKFPSSSGGKTALFRSAFLSYQVKDYDGADRKFSEFLKRYKSSNLSKSAKYNLAWIKYLKGNYDEAIDGFSTVLEAKLSRKRGFRRHSVDKLQYWLAMSHFRKGEYGKAKFIFDHLKKNRLRSYYTFASIARLSELNKKIKKQSLVNFEGGSLVPGLSSRELSTFAEKVYINLPPDSLLEGADSTESDVSMTAIELEEESRESKTEKFWSSRRVYKNLNRINDLIELGLFHWAFSALKEIEPYVKDKEIYRKFISNYEGLNKFHRSSYLAEIKFINPVEIKGSFVWQSSFPRPYSNSVEKYSGDFSVPKNFVWSIMRAESRFNPTVESPVGAKGLMQLMPYTAEKVYKLLSKRVPASLNLKNPETNIKLGTRYLSRLLDLFNQKLPLAAGAYNAGPHRVIDWTSKFGHLEMDEFIEHVPFVETRNYMKKVVKYMGTYGLVYGEPENTQFLAKSLGYKWEGPVPTKENWD